MKAQIHILFKFVDGAWGGGNQFLKALRDYFRNIGVYSENPEDADVILFNSYPFGSEYLFDLTFKLKRKFPNKILIHRLDGPISYVRGNDAIFDKAIVQFNSLFADGTIFQSKWSKEKNYENRLQKSPYETSIINAPDKTIFNNENKKSFNKRKIKLVATSWSSNMRKGFDIYKFLDKHLDFEKYEMTFVGNSPIQFKNIRWLRPVPSNEIAEILKKHDIFITASKSDPCSNSLIEALHCGLPAVARNDGGHPEIVGSGGEFFEDEEEVTGAIEKVVMNYEYYRSQIELPTLEEVGKKYYEFAQMIYKDYLDGNYNPKKIELLDFMKLTKIKMKMLTLKIYNSISYQR